MSIRPTTSATPPTPARLTRVPKAPVGLSAEEVKAWKRVAQAAVDLGTLAASDGPLLARLAQVAARVDRLLADRKAAPSHIAALIGLEERLMRAFGLSPLARRGVAPLPERQANPQEDPLSEFDR